MFSLKTCQPAMGNRKEKQWPFVWCLKGLKAKPICSLLFSVISGGCACKGLDVFVQKVKMHSQQATSSGGLFDDSLMLRSI